MGQVKSNGGTSRQLFFSGLMTMTLLSLSGCKSDKPSFHYESLTAAHWDYHIQLEFSPLSAADFRKQIDVEQYSANAQIARFKVQMSDVDKAYPDRIIVREIIVTGKNSDWNLMPVTSEGLNHLTLIPSTDPGHYKGPDLYLPQTKNENVVVRFTAEFIRGEDRDLVPINQRLGTIATQGPRNLWQRFIAIFGF